MGEQGPPGQPFPAGLDWAMSQGLGLGPEHSLPAHCPSGRSPRVGTGRRAPAGQRVPGPRPGEPRLSI